jgi:hypothetical protein
MHPNCKTITQKGSSILINNYLTNVKFYFILTRNLTSFLPQTANRQINDILNIFCLI